MMPDIDIELMIAPDGDLCILHNLVFPKPPQWAEFDAYTNRLLLIFDGGERTEMFEVTQQNAIPIFRAAEKILLVLMDEARQPVEELEIPMSASVLYNPTHKKKAPD